MNYDLIIEQLAEIMSNVLPLALITGWCEYLANMVVNAATGKGFRK